MSTLAGNSERVIGLGRGRLIQRHLLIGDARKRIPPSEVRSRLRRCLLDEGFTILTQGVEHAKRILNSRSVVRRTERVIVNVVRYAPTFRNSFGLVESPVDSQIDTALTVLLLGLRKP